MNRNYVRYLPWIIVIALLVVSGVVFYARGGFDNENNEKIAGASDTSPTSSPDATPTESPTSSPTPALTPVSVPVRVPVASPLTTTPIPLGTIPSITGIRGGEDD